MVEDEIENKKWNKMRMTGRTRYIVVAGGRSRQRSKSRRSISKKRKSRSRRGGDVE